MLSSHRRLAMRPTLAVLTGALLSGCAISPTPLTESALSDIARKSIANVAADQEPIRGAISVHQAIARALRYNLDHQVELAEYALRERELDLAHYSLLPKLVADTAYAARDSLNASSSQNVLTGEQSLATSTSQDQRYRTADAVFSWNILDFGLSYVRARQAADKVLVQNELRRKTTLRIADDTRAAFYRALSAQRLMKRLAGVEKMAHAVEGDARGLAGDRVSSPITALTYEREIIEIQRTIGEVQRELNTAHVQLAALMNVPPGTAFTLVDVPRSLPPLPRQPIADLLHTAVSNRPEMREAAYRQRINEAEATAALLELLPGINLYVDAEYDSNSFLFKNRWQDWGARASWNLLKVFSYPAQRAVVEQQDAMLKQKALAVTMAIMTQVYVSRIRYAQAGKDYRIARRFLDVQRRLLEQMRHEAAADRISRQTLVREELNTVVAEARRDMAYAALQSAAASVQTSLGLEPDFESVAGATTTVRRDEASLQPSEFATAAAADTVERP